MYNHNGGNDSPMQPNISTVSPERPPQLKARNCNYDCGYGCTKESDDEGGGAESDGNTLVGEEEEEESGGESGDLSGSEESMPDSGASVSDGTGSEFSSSSMVVELASSGDCSRASSPARSLTPGPGNSTLLVGLMRVPIRYYFLQTPLRLSVQIEHCRGDPGSPLVPERVRLSS
ncbi:hypothetical protein COCVIDRAFT_16892 [Bipolaris victoriae FI3]|uniref:Uncharacterized protein n=1 Tax=Bipolaris victoriae (strain FI3) TaxID=930091 RepID=W7EH02_BIPV3|nr:hypothetical protein COCVIDRAFT_16892 [Bipolaris victoriae FI3]